MRGTPFGIADGHKAAAKQCCEAIHGGGKATDAECAGKKKNTENAAAGAGAGKGGKGVASEALLDSLSATCRMSVEKFLGIPPKPLGYVVNCTPYTTTCTLLHAILREVWKSFPLSLHVPPVVHTKYDPSSSVEYL